MVFVFLFYNIIFVQTNIYALWLYKFQNIYAKTVLFLNFQSATILEIILA